MNNDITIDDIHGAFPLTIHILASHIDDFRKDSEKNPTVILRELDRQQDDEIKERIMSLARDTIDPQVFAWFKEIEMQAAIRYAKRKVKELEAEDLAIKENLGIYENPRR